MNKQPIYNLYFKINLENPKFMDKNIFLGYYVR